MITLFDQTKKYYNKNNEILYLVSQIALQGTSMVGTTEPSSSDRHALFLTEGNFAKLNLDKILVHVMRYCVIKSVCIGTANCCWSRFSLFYFKYENINFHKQSKEPTKYQNLSISTLGRLILNINDLDCHVQFFLWYWIITW